MSNDSNIPNAKDLISKVHECMNPVLTCFFNDIAVQRSLIPSLELAENRNGLRRDLEKITRIGWELVDMPLVTRMKIFEELQSACRSVSLRYGIAISPQTSRDLKYFRGILVDKRSLLRATNGSTEWINPPEGMFFKIIPLLDYVLISMKDCNTFSYKFNHRGNKAKMIMMYDRRFNTNK